MTIRLLAIDLDGTLLDSSWNLSETNHHALTAARARGVDVAFVTGRRYSSARTITKPVGFPHFLITNAGALVRSSTGERLFANFIDRALLREFVAHMRQFRSFMFLICDTDGPGEILCQDPLETNVHIARYLGLNHAFLLRTSSLEEAIPPNVLQVAFMGTLSEMMAVEQAVDSFSKRHAMNLLRTEYTARDFCLLDVVDGESNKGRALRKLAALRKIPREEIMAIGDNHSDADMLGYAGFPVVMENAPDELKARGWPITASNDRDGVAKAIERYILS